jgi:hypothetical protein
VVDILSRCDYSSLDFKNEIGDFIQVMVLKKPVDETTSLFLDLHIDFICFVACGCFGTNPEILKIPVIDEHNKLREYLPNLFGKKVIPKRQEKFITENPSEFYAGFVVTNLLLIHEIYRQKISTNCYATQLSRSITIMLSFQQLYFVERDLMQIFMHSFYIPTLDDCLSLAGQVEGQDVYKLAAAAEYFVIEMVRFLLITNRHDYAKEVMHLLVDYAVKKATQPNKKSILFSLSCIGDLYPDFALSLDYKDRDALIETACMLMSEIQEKLAEFMNRYFEGIAEDKHLEVFYLIDCYQRVANLVSKLVLKSYVYLTESVAHSYPATHRVLQNCQREPGFVFQV